MSNHLLLEIFLVSSTSHYILAPPWYRDIFLLLHFSFHLLVFKIPVYTMVTPFFLSNYIDLDAFLARVLL